MKKLALASMMAFSLFGLNSIAHSEGGPDTFKISVFVDDYLQGGDSSDFEKRLKRAARDYCDDAAPTASRRAKRDCRSSVEAAVKDAMELKRVALASPSRG